MFRARSRRFKFEKSRQFFIGTYNKTLSVTVRVHDEHRLAVGIHRRHTAPTPTGFAEIVGDYCPVIHMHEQASRVQRVVTSLFSPKEMPITRSSSKKTLSLSSARAINRRPSRAYASAVKITRPVESISLEQPQLKPALLSGLKARYAPARPLSYCVKTNPSKSGMRSMSLHLNEVGLIIKCTLKH